MSRPLRAFPFDGINTDSMGHYLAGLGLLAVTARRWPMIRACWRDGRFMLLSDQINDVSQIKEFLLSGWKPVAYERWWSAAQKADTKAKTSINLWKGRNNGTADEVKLLDAHVVGMGRNCFNPVLGTGGNVGKRDFAKAWAVSAKLLKQPTRSAWLDATLTGRADCGLPDLSSGGTWFVFANRKFNSGQDWYRDGQLSPWSFLLSMEGAFLLVGGINRRLGSHSRPYAVFPFVSEPSQPMTAGEVGLARAEFWAPLWKNPAIIGEVEQLMQRGLAGLGGQFAKAPHEFAVAVLSMRVDAGIAAFARYELRRTTSSQVFEAIPREHFEADIKSTGSTQGNTRAVASKLLSALLESGWLDKLPYEPRDPKQKGKFVGLRGPIEAAIMKASECPTDEARWQTLLLKLANVQFRVDRNRYYREHCTPLEILQPDWFDLAFPSVRGIPAEVEIARAIASIGWPMEAGNVPLLANVFGVEVQVKRRNIRIRFPRARTAQAVWGSSAPRQLLLDVAHRRLIDAGTLTPKPFAATYDCPASFLHRLLRDDATIDLDKVIRWIPALSLIDWSDRPIFDTAGEAADALDGTMLIQALARPLFHGREVGMWDHATQSWAPLFPQPLEPTAGLLRSVFNLLRYNSHDEAIHVLRDRYLAAGRTIVMPPPGYEANGELVAASLLIPVSDQTVIRGLRRWLQPARRN